MAKKTKKPLQKLWGAAFGKKPKDQAVLFASGRDVQFLPAADEPLIPYEIRASKAYAKALFDQEIIDKKTLNKLLKGLKKLNQLFRQGKFKLDFLKEDVHTNVEAFLIEECGIDVGGKIHSGRSRSEQSVVDLIIFMKEQNKMIKKGIKELIKALNQQAKKYSQVLIPGYTHYQHATVTTFGNMLDAYAKAFEKDLKRFDCWHQIEEVSPFGSGASYGSTFPISKEEINQYLKLKNIFENEIQILTFKGDAETMMVFNLAMFMNHLSSLAQTLIIFNTKEFGFIEINDQYSTGSSMMPQKKNPDPLEVIKAKASICHGYLMALLSITKAPFIGYNRDLQWVKYPLMDAINETLMTPKIIVGAIKTMKVNIKAMQKWATKGFILAQAVMEGIAMEFDLSMRLAKIIVAKTVKKCQVKGGFNLKVLNQVISEFKLDIKVSQVQFKKWTNPLYVAKAQMKGGEKNEVQKT
jgi:argininosuccinate lyase